MAAMIVMICGKVEELLKEGVSNDRTVVIQQSLTRFVFSCCFYRFFMLDSPIK